MIVLSFVAALSLFARAEESKACRIDLASDPEGAMVVFDGVSRGRTPLTIWDARAGVHHARFELADYETADTFITAGAGEYVQRAVTLPALKGLLLLTSEPEGCDVSVDGLSLGETPRLVTTLDAKDAYRVTFQKTGYVPQRLEVKFNGRTPLVRHAKMVLDSGVLQVQSVPEGAEISVNGAVKGVAPLTVADMLKGESVVSAKLEGYRPQSRKVVLKAGDVSNLTFEMEGLPGGLKIGCEPRGATVFVDGEQKGKAPLEIRNVACGEHVIRLSHPGFADFTKTATVDVGKVAEVEFTLEDVSGSVEVKSIPAGVQVFLDGVSAGVTRAKAGSDRSEVLEIAGVLEGEHELKFKLEGHADETRMVKVEKKKAFQTLVRMKRQFIPNVEVITLSGTYRGVLLSNTADGIQIEISPGVTRVFRQVDIREMNFLDGMK